MTDANLWSQKNLQTFFKILLSENYFTGLLGCATTLQEQLNYKSWLSVYVHWTWVCEWIFFCLSASHLGGLRFLEVYQEQPAWATTIDLFRTPSLSLCVWADAPCVSSPCLHKEVSLQSQYRSEECQWVAAVLRHPSLDTPHSVAYSAT